MILAKDDFANNEEAIHKEVYSRDAFNDHEQTAVKEVYTPFECGQRFTTVHIVTISERNCVTMTADNVTELSNEIIQSDSSYIEI